MALAIDSQMPSGVAQAFEQSSGKVNSENPVTFAFTNTAGTVLYAFVCLGMNTGGTCSFGTVSYNGVSMTNIHDQTTASGASRLGIFRLLSPATGSNTFSVAFSMTLGGANNSSLWAGLISLTGNHATTPEAQAESGSNGSGTTASCSLTGVTSGNITIGAAATGSNVTSSTQTTSCTADTAGDLTQAGNGRVTTSTSSGSVTHSFSLASDSWCSAIVEVAAAADGGPASTLWTPSIRRVF